MPAWNQTDLTENKQEQSYTMPRMLLVLQGAVWRVMLMLLYGLFVLKDISFSISSKEIIACKYFSGTDFLLEIAADSAPAVHIVGYLEAGPAFAPDVAPRQGGYSPLVLPPRRVASVFCRRMW